MKLKLHLKSLCFSIQATPKAKLKGAARVQMWWSVWDDNQRVQNCLDFAIPQQNFLSHCDW